MKNITPLPPTMSAKRIVLALLLAGLGVVSLTGCILIRDGRREYREPSQEHMHAYDHDDGHNDHR